MVILWQSPVTEAQTKPLTCPEIITALNTKLPKQFFKTKVDLLRWLVGEIQKRKIDKVLTADREDDLRQAGATDELIEIIRQNSPLPPKVVSTPMPKPMSTQVPTPTSTPTPDNSPPVTGKEQIPSISGKCFQRT